MSEYGGCHYKVKYNPHKLICMIVGMAAIQYTL